MTTQTYPSGKVIGYEYDDKGELVSMSIDGVPFIKNIKTNNNGLQSYEYADGSKHTRTYDTNGRVTKLSYPNYTEEVNYNVVSNITNVKSDYISRAFGYDNLDRLTSYDQNATDFQNFVYDANGNRLNQEQDNNESKVFTYANNSNILNSIEESNSTDSKTINYEYDKTGNIIKDAKHVYSYDSRNRLTAIDNNVTYEYNYDNKRVSKTVNGVKTYFVYDGHMLVGEYPLNLSDDSRQEFVYLNSTPIATLKPKENYRVYADHLDTSRRVTTNDDKAEVLWSWESKPFGESEAKNDVDGDGKEFVQNLRFPGQYLDVETSTHYNINRDYNPVTGRYIQSDPIGFDGGVNGFGYVGGMPIILVDEQGLYSFNSLLNKYQRLSSLNPNDKFGYNPWLLGVIKSGGSCATRMSNAFNLAGYSSNITNFPRKSRLFKDRYGIKYVIGAKELAAHLGVFTSSNKVNSLNELLHRKGIIFFDNPDHIDLFYTKDDAFWWFNVDYKTYIHGNRRFVSQDDIDGGVYVKDVT